MLDKEKLLQFLLEARTKTYAGGKGKVKPILINYFLNFLNRHYAYFYFRILGLRA